MHMDDDAVIRDRVAAELDFDPGIRASGIAVAARRGIVTLYGDCPSHADKVGAIRAAHRIEGVRGVAMEVIVRKAGDIVRGDFEIADEIAFDLASKNLAHGVRITVENASVTLHGCVAGERQRHEIEARVRRLAGVVCVTNTLHLACDREVIDIQERLAGALRRNPSLAAEAIRVQVKGTEVTLAGEVSSHLLARDAETAAWTIPGVTRVENALTVG
jgi:osmotically-inducible protein OsmY